MKTNKILRFGVIGCGSMASQVHCPNLNSIPNAKTVAYCDINEEKAKNLLQAYGGEYTTTDANRIFNDPSIDAVLIQVGPSQHARLVQSAAKAGKHIFVEKPIAIELSDALETIRIVESSGVKFIYGTCNRLAPMVQRAKRLCPDPLYTFCQCSGTITHQACHNIDLAVNFFHDSPVSHIYASGSQVWNLDPHLPADSFAAVITFENNSVHNYIQHGNSHNVLLKKYHYQLFGRTCCVFLAKRFKECHLMRSPDKVEQSWIFEGHDMDRGQFGYMGHYEEIAELVKCILTGEGNGTMTVYDAAYTLAVEKAILESITTKKVIVFADFLRKHNAEFLLANKNNKKEDSSWKNI